MDFLIHHWLEVVLAALFAIIADYLRVGSLLRGVERHIKNKLAERSIEKLKRRITVLQDYRAAVASMISDRGAYLATTTFVFAILGCLCVGVFILLFNTMVLFPNAPGGWMLTPIRFSGLLVMLVALVLVWQGLRFTSTGTIEAMSELLNNLDGDIVTLKAKLTELQSQHA